MTKGDLPPDICVEIALWDRFGWGPEDTDHFTLKEMRELFSVLEQQRVSKNAVDLGAPSEQKLKALLDKKKAESDAKTTKTPLKTIGGKNATTHK